MKNDVAALKVAVVEISETVKRIEKYQEKNQRILKVLSERSIEHEVELKRIKY